MADWLWLVLKWLAVAVAVSPIVIGIGWAVVEGSILPRLVPRAEIEATPAVQPFASVFFNSASMRRLTSGSSFLCDMTKSSNGRMPTKASMSRTEGSASRPEAKNFLKSGGSRRPKNATRWRKIEPKETQNDSSEDYYAVIATGQGTPIDDIRDRLYAILGRPATFRLRSFSSKPSGIVTHHIAEVKFVTDAADDRLDLIEAAEIED